MRRRRLPPPRWVVPVDEPGPPDHEIAMLQVWFDREDPDDPTSQPIRISGISMWHRDGPSPTILGRFHWATWLPIAELIARTRGDVGDILWRSGDVFDPKTVQGQIQRAYYDDIGLAYDKRRPGRKGNDPALYERVAKRYVELVSIGIRNPTQTIAAELGYSRNTVAGWIRKAREHGHLPPARKGKAG